jgi:hypothetical protein
MRGLMGNLEVRSYFSVCLRREGDQAIARRPVERTWDALWKLRNILAFVYLRGGAGRIVLFAPVSGSGVLDTGRRKCLRMARRPINFRELSTFDSYAISL